MDSPRPPATRSGSISSSPYSPRLLPPAAGTTTPRGGGSRAPPANAAPSWEELEAAAAAAAVRGDSPSGSTGRGQRRASAHKPQQQQQRSGLTPRDAVNSHTLSPRGQAVLRHAAEASAGVPPLGGSVQDDSHVDARGGVSTHAHVSGQAVEEPTDDEPVMLTAAQDAHAGGPALVLKLPITWEGSLGVVSSAVVNSDEAKKPALVVNAVMPAAPKPALQTPPAVAALPDDGIGRHSVRVADTASDPAALQRTRDRMFMTHHGTMSTSIAPASLAAISFRGAGLPVRAVSKQLRRGSASKATPLWRRAAADAGRLLLLVLWALIGAGIIAAGIWSNNIKVEQTVHP
jgi:hypothetical protein